jgi:imidazolonepropionase-like amidohydrolase
MLGDQSHLALRVMAANHEILSPRIYTSGPSFNGNSVTSPERARQMVIDQKNDGYDFLKLHPGLTMASYDAIVATADSVGIPFAGHISTGVGLERTLEAHQATIDHLDGYVEAMATAGGSPIPSSQSQFFGLNMVLYADASVMPELAEMTLEAGVWNVPTQSLFPDYMGFSDPLGDEREDLQYVPSNMVEGWSNRANSFSDQLDPEAAMAFIEIRRGIIKTLHDAGAGILLGSDAPQVFQVPGFSMHEELAEYVAAGLTPFQALQTGTVNVAQFYDAEDERGTVAEGMVADLILVNGNPLENVGAVRRPAGVMVRGEWVSGEEIEARLETLAGD